MDHCQTQPAMLVSGQSWTCIGYLTRAKWTLAACVSMETAFLSAFLYVCLLLPDSWYWLSSLFILCVGCTHTSTYNRVVQPADTLVAQNWGLEAALNSNQYLFSFGYIQSSMISVVYFLSMSMYIYNNFPLVLVLDACLRCQTEGKQEECVGEWHLNHVITGKNEHSPLPL